MPQERRDRRLWWASLAVFLASMTFLIVQAFKSMGDRARIDAENGEQARAIRHNSSRIDLSTEMARQARGDHAAILAELKAIREAVEAAR